MACTPAHAPVVRSPSLTTLRAGTPICEVTTQVYTYTCSVRAVYLPKRAKYRESSAVGDCNAIKMSLQVPQTSSPGAAAGGAKKLLVVGLCGEAIKVEWSPEDTVGAVKDKAYSAAASTLLADGSRCSLVQGSCLFSRAASLLISHLVKPQR
jgi:hypothetical protein